MQIEILQARDYRPFGAREPGEIVEVSETVGRQLIEQGFAREVRTMQQRGATHRTGASNLKQHSEGE